jgi:hypothetical protein
LNYKRWANLVVKVMPNRALRRKIRHLIPTWRVKGWGKEKWKQTKEKALKMVYLKRTSWRARSPTAVLYICTRSTYYYYMSHDQ